MIRIVWHIACMGNWESVVREQVAALRDSGLLDAAGEILAHVGGDGMPELPKQIRVISRSAVAQYEFPALRIAREIAEPGDAILYLHTKGVSRKGDGARIGALWREYMQWGCIERWREHVGALSSHDVSGVQLTRLAKKFVNLCGAPTVFAGNFWWARGEWLASLPVPHDAECRWLAEGWVMGRGDGRYNDMHNLTGGEPVTEKKPFGEPGFSRATYDPVIAEAVPSMIDSRHAIINALIHKYGYRRYLEIGVEAGRCFRKIECELKESVDPFQRHATHVMTSDAFFENDRREWDIVFIDGLHLEEQAYRDMENALERLAECGTVVVHDCNPETEFEQREIDAYDKQGIWVGTVWRAFARLRMERADLSMWMIDTDFGCGIIRKGRQTPYPTHELTFPFFVQNRRELMNVIDPEDFWSWLDTLKS